MAVNPRRGGVEEVIIIAGLIVVQIFHAGNSVLLSRLLFLGLNLLNPLTIIIFSAFATFLVLSPLSVYLERGAWPEKFSLKLLIQLVLVAFGGVTLFQSLYLKGIKLTSPAVATAMPNLAQGLIFLIAAAFRLEKVKLSCMYSKMKIAGTLLCVIGAFTMSIVHSTLTPPMAKDGSKLVPAPAARGSTFDSEKIIGCVYLMAGVLVLSGNIVLQFSVSESRKYVWQIAFEKLFSKEFSEFIPPFGDRWNVIFGAHNINFHTNFHVCSNIYIGAAITAIIELIQDHKFDVGWPVSVLAGMFLVFSGLYFFLWAKGKEGFMVGDGEAKERKWDVEKPLLS
ncbi:hypothetical protein NMG60_11030293 [Bertholletia excelsa]